MSKHVCTKCKKSFEAAPVESPRSHKLLCGDSTKPEDVARLSPLGHEHINVLGRYSFALADGIAEGELRPLRHPDDGDVLTVGAA